MAVLPHEPNPNACPHTEAMQGKPIPKTYGKIRKKTPEMGRHIWKKIAKRRRKNKVARASRRRNR